MRLATQQKQRDSYDKSHKANNTNNKQHFQRSSIQ